MKRELDAKTILMLLSLFAMGLCNVGCAHIGGDMTLKQVLNMPTEEALESCTDNLDGVSEADLNNPEYYNLDEYLGPMTEAWQK